MNIGAGNVILMECFLETQWPVSAAYLKHKGLQIGARELRDGENRAQNFTRLTHDGTSPHLPFEFHLT